MTAEATFHVEHRRQGYFVTGTDTGVGKTFVTAALARRARQLRPDARVLGFKPIETGCEAELGEDQRTLTEAAGGWQTGRLRGLYQFRLPAAPRVAAEAEGRRVEMAAVIDAVREGSTQAWLTLVEGAGGWRVPITDAIDMSGLARALNLPVVVVARAGLGTINHSLLSVEAVERDGCSVAALVLSRRPDDDPAFAASNAHEIGRAWPGRIIVLGDDPAVLDELLR